MNKQKNRRSFEDVCAFESKPSMIATFQGCGHREKTQGVICVYGRKFDFEVGSAKIENVAGQKVVHGRDSTCPVCLVAEMKKCSIRCAACGMAILPGEAVALYCRSSPNCQKGLKAKIATLVGENVIGCLKWDCCPTGGAFAGYWSEKGFKPAFPSGRGLAAEAFATGKPQFATTGDKK